MNSHRDTVYGQMLNGEADRRELCRLLELCHPNIQYYCSLKTSSSAVAKRPRDASCLSVVSFVASILQYLERSFLSLVTSASDLLCIQFDSVLLSSA